MNTAPITRLQAWARVWKQQFGRGAQVPLPTYLLTSGDLPAVGQAGVSTHQVATNRTRCTYGLTRLGSVNPGRMLKIKQVASLFSPGTNHLSHTQQLSRSSQQHPSSCASMTRHNLVNAQSSTSAWQSRFEQPSRDWSELRQPLNRWGAGISGTGCSLQLRLEELTE